MSFLCLVIFKYSPWLSSTYTSCMGGFSVIDSHTASGLITCNQNLTFRGNDHIRLEHRIAVLDKVISTVVDESPLVVNYSLQWRNTFAKPSRPLFLILLLTSTVSRTVPSVSDAILGIYFKQEQKCLMRGD